MEKKNNRNHRHRGNSKLTLFQAALRVQEIRCVLKSENRSEK